MKQKITPEEKALIRRYLVWCYKTTKEELDRIDRKFTQLAVDYHILRKLSATKVHLSADDKELYDRQFNDFKEYIRNKGKESTLLKFSDPQQKSIHPEYLYLKNRLAAIEVATGFFLGKQELRLTKADYEAEMTKRIWEAREHSWGSLEKERRAG